MAKTDSGRLQSPWILAVIVLVALVYVDFKMPGLTQWTDFSRIYYGCAKSGLTFVSNPPHRSQEAAILTAFVPTAETYCDPPQLLSAFKPLAQLDLATASAIWHALSLLALCLSASYITKAAARTDEESGSMTTAGWTCLTFAPLVLTLCLGQVSLVFGLLPFAIGYYLLCSKKPILAGLVMSITLIKPAFFLIAVVNAIAQFYRGKYKFAVALAIGSIIFFATFLFESNMDYLLQWLSTLGVQPNLDPRLNVSFQHSALLLTTPDHHAALKPLMLIIAGLIAIGGIVQLRELARSEKKLEIAPYATMLGAMLAPILAPSLALQDLTVMLAGGLVAYCYEWREHMEFRVRTIARMSWLFSNIYVVLFYCNPSIAQPAGLALLILALYMRIAETIRFAVSTPDV